MWDCKHEKLTLKVDVIVQCKLFIIDDHIFLYDHCRRELTPKQQQTPEFLWNDTEFESVYRAVYRYMEVAWRLEVLNKRLTIVGELLDVLRSQQEHIHANKLEWVIIILVAMEVILQLVWNILLKDVLGWVGQGRDE